VTARDAPMPPPEERGLASAAEQVLDALPAPVCVLRGRELRHAYANAAFQALRPGVALVGRTLAEVFPEAAGALEPLFARVLERGEPYEAADVPVALARPDGTVVERHFSIVLVPADGDGIVAAAIETTGRVAATARAALFARMVAELSAGADLTAVMTTALTRAVELLRGDDGSLFFFEGERGELVGKLELRAVGRVGKAVDLEAMPNVRAALRDGAPRWLSRATASAGERARMDRLGTVGALLCPLALDERRLGVLVVSFDRTPALSDDDLALGDAIARQCALALERARLLDAERLAWRRLALSQEVTAALAAARGEADVVRVMMDVALPSSGAYAGMFAVEEGDALAVGASAGYDPPLGAPPPRFPLAADLPATRAFRTREPVWVASPDELRARFPACVPELRGSRTRAWAAVPLALGVRCLGVLGLSYDASRAFADGERAWLVSLAQRCAQALDGARLVDALEQANRHKDELLAMLAHELRNPLAAIRNAALVARTRAASGQDVRRPFEILERQIANSARILEDLFDVSAVKRGLVALQRRRLRLDEVLASAVESQRSALDARGHHLAVDLGGEPLVLDADATRLEQVFANLLHNAAKYTPPGGHVALRARRDGGEAVVTVSDDGRGIDPALLPRIFDVFVQGETQLDRPQGGLGLGLTLVRRLVELHGGAVSARSDGRGRGSAFTVRLPLAAAAPGAERRGGDAPAPARARRRVLVVEDNVDAAEMLGALLAELGHEVRLAGDGDEALAAIASYGPDLVLLDIGIPRVDGYEVARRVRAASGRAPTLVALTGYGQAEDRARALAAGFDEHLTKPVDLAALTRILAG
jgi:signal transduction histidine kinase/CheY-like chemotaxis protein